MLFLLIVRSLWSCVTKSCSLRTVGLTEDPNSIERKLLEEMSMVLRGERAPLEPSSNSLSKPSLTQSSYATSWGSSVSSLASQSFTRTAKIDACDSEHRSPLMLAVYGGHLNVVGALLARGSKILNVDRYGRNCMHYSHQNKRKDILDVLKNTLRERRAIEYELKLAETQRLKEYFAAILRRVAAGGNKTTAAKKSNRRKQRPMTAPGNRRKNRSGEKLKRPAMSRYAYAAVV